jgi:stage V sporulation protein AD
MFFFVKKTENGRGVIDIEKTKLNQTIFFKNRPAIIGSYSVAGKKESEGLLKPFFSETFTDCYFGEKTHEGAEQKMYETAIRGAINSAKLTPEGIDMILAGDLLNQITSSSFAARGFDTCFIGMYGACSTMALSLGMSALLCDGGYAENVVACAGSHFATAERQYRTPLELGNQRSPLSQWTVTGCGATVVSNVKERGIAKISAVTFGKVVDYGVIDVNNMGGAMAPAGCIL